MQKTQFKKILSGSHNKSIYGLFVSVDEERIMNWCPVTQMW